MKNLFTQLNLRGQIAQGLRTLIPMLTVAVAIVLGLYLFGTSHNIPLMDLSRDPAATLKAPFYIGILSNLGIWFWAAITVTCLFAGGLHWMAPPTARVHAHFLFASGLFTFLLGFDDMLMLHEEVLPKYLGIPEDFVMVGYLGLFGGYIIAFLRYILQHTNFLLLGIGGFFFALSILTDQFFQVGPRAIFLEDSFKFTGILTWLAYYTQASLVSLSSQNQREYLSWPQALRMRQSHETSIELDKSTK